MIKKELYDFIVEQTENHDYVKRKYLYKWASDNNYYWNDVSLALILLIEDGKVYHAYHEGEKQHIYFVRLHDKTLNDMQDRGREVNP